MSYVSSRKDTCRPVPACSPEWPSDLLVLTAWLTIMLDIDWMVTLMKVKEMPITEMMPAGHQVWHWMSADDSPHNTVQQEVTCLCLWLSVQAPLCCCVQAEQSAPSCSSWGSNVGMKQQQG